MSEKDEEAAYAAQCTREAEVMIAALKHQMMSGELTQRIAACVADVDKLLSQHKMSTLTVIAVMGALTSKLVRLTPIPVETTSVLLVVADLAEFFMKQDDAREAAQQPKH